MHRMLASMITFEVLRAAAVKYATGVHVHLYIWNTLLVTLLTNVFGTLIISVGTNTSTYCSACGRTC